MRTRSRDGCMDGHGVPSFRARRRSCAPLPSLRPGTFRHGCTRHRSPRPRRHPSSGKYPAGPPRSRRGGSWRQSPKDPKNRNARESRIRRSAGRNTATMRRVISGAHVRGTCGPGYAPVASACIRDRRPARVRNRARRRCAITVTGFGRHRKSGRLLQIARGEAGVPYCMRSEHPRRSRGRLRTTRSIPRW